MAFPVSVCRDKPRNVFTLRTHSAETSRFSVFSPEQGVIERRNKGQAFRFCQSESFSVGVVPNLREKQKCAPFFSETSLFNYIPTHLSTDSDCSPLILEPLDHQMRRRRGNHNGGRNPHFPSDISSSQTCIPAWKNRTVDIKPMQH